MKYKCDVVLPKALGYRRETLDLASNTDVWAVIKYLSSATFRQRLLQTQNEKNNNNQALKQFKMVSKGY